MPQVPYQPYPQREPSQQGTPGVSVRAEPAAFGVNIGHALEGLGSQLEKSGGELYARAEAIQMLRNETEAKEADAEYMIQVGKLHADYSALQGKAAAQAYPKYMEDIRGLRTQMREGLSNDMARKMFDGPSLSTMGRTIFNGAGHAASENKKWALGASEARVGAAANTAREMPNDDVGFQRSIKMVENEKQQQGELAGKSPEEIKYDTDVAVSKLWSERITGLARTKPFAAQKMLNENRDKLKGLDGERTDKAVTTQVYSVGARNIAVGVNSGRDMKIGETKVPIEQAKVAIGTFESGNNYASQGKETKYGRALGKYQVMEAFLPEFLKEAGMKPMTKEEFLKDGQAQEQLFTAIFGGYMEKYGSFNEAASKWFTGKTIAEYKGAKDANNTDLYSYLRNTNAILARNASLRDRVDRGLAQSRELVPDDPLMEEYVTREVEGSYNRQQQIKKNDDFNNKQTVELGIIGGSSQGKLPTTLDELKAADPKVEEAWAKLEPSDQRKYLNVLSSNARGDRAWTPESLKKYQQLKGMAHDDPGEFMSQDIISENFPNRTKLELINLQQKLRSNVESDPRVTRALQILSPELTAAQISKANNKDIYHQFTGSLQDALQDYQTDNKGKTPTVDEIRTIGSRLIQQTATGRPGWWNTLTFGAINTKETQPLFESAVPEKEIEKIKADPTWAKIGVEPTDDMIRRIYVRNKYKELYGSSPTKPQVPQSR